MFSPSSLEQRVRILVHLLVAQEMGRPTTFSALQEHLPETPVAALQLAVERLREMGVVTVTARGLLPRGPPLPPDITPILAERSRARVVSPTWY